MPFLIVCGLGPLMVMLGFFFLHSVTEPMDVAPSRWRIAGLIGSGLMLLAFFQYSIFMGVRLFIVR